MVRALVGDGGGHLAVYIWGILTELLRLGMPKHYFDVHVCTSASSFNSAFLEADQLKEGYNIWVHHLTKGFWKPYKNDMRYLERILRELEPLNCAVLKQLRQKIYIALSNPQTLRSELKCLNDAKDLVLLLLASAAMPYLTGPVRIDGKEFYDAGLTSQPPLEHVWQFQPDEVWVFMTSPKDHRVRGVEAKVLQLAGMCAVHDRQVGKLLKNSAKLRNQALEEVEFRSDLLVFRPQERLPISWRCCDAEAAKKTFELGRQSVQTFGRNHNW